MNYDLYVIIDENVGRGRTHAEIAERAIAGGADAIQLREKSFSSSELIRIGRVIRGITQRSSTLFIVNDRLDVALACGADGVHLGQGDMRTDVARQTHTPGFHYRGVGQVPLKRHAGQSRKERIMLRSARPFPRDPNRTPGRDSGFRFSGRSGGMCLFR